MAWWTSLTAICVFASCGGPIKLFSYQPHLLPRVFVSHHPLHPQPGQSVTMRVAPEFELAAGEFDGLEVRVRLRHSEGGLIEDQSCEGPIAGEFHCTFELPNDAGLFVYRAEATASGGEPVRSLTSYRFQVGDGGGENELVVLREPLVPFEELDADYRMDLALVRDPSGPGSSLSEAEFLAAAEEVLYEGLLSDSVYRWRDNQLGFYATTRPGLTTSYYSGRDTRCGQNAWPGEFELPSELSIEGREIEVLGVLHRRAAAGDGLEGSFESGQAGTGLPGVFRDCAGTAVRDSEVGTFSVRVDHDASAEIAVHEFGHAAFGIGDEYNEETATRQVNPQPGSSVFNGCCCKTEGDGNGGFDGGVGGGGGVLPAPDRSQSAPQAGDGRILSNHATAVCAPGDVIAPFGAVVDSLESCGEPPSWPPSCFGNEEGACPDLVGDCVRAAMWLGLGPPVGVEVARPNVFETAEACAEARAAAQTHPGVERQDKGIGQCRILCGDDGNPCPCNRSGSLWIVDRNPAVNDFELAENGVMSEVEAGRDHGGTCAWCVETSLCVRWQLALGDTADQAWETCQAPPEYAGVVEGFLEHLARVLLEWLRELLG